jgi:hypothetical protein
MKLTFVPLLQTQRELYDLPRNMERFNAYLATMKDPTTGDLKLPLVAMNPMGKEHVRTMRRAGGRTGTSTTSVSASRRRRSIAAAG